LVTVELLGEARESAVLPLLSSWRAHQLTTIDKIRVGYLQHSIKIWIQIVGVSHARRAHPRSDSRDLLDLAFSRAALS